MKKALIIGGGFAGCAASHQLALKGGWEVTIIEKSSFLGAGVRTSWYGGHPYTFGPRHFLTKDEHLFEYLNKYIPLRKLSHTFVTYIESDSSFYNFPIHWDDIHKMPDKEKIFDELNSISDGIEPKNLEEYWVNTVGETLYTKFAKHYNYKMWQTDDNTIIDANIPDWTSKGSFIYKGETKNFHDSISAYPIASNGYDDYFDLSTSGAEILLNTEITDYDLGNKQIYLNSTTHSFDIIINTISPDIPYNFCYGKLKYVGLDFHTFVLPIENAFPDDIFFLYFSGKEKFKRLVEYKKFTQHKSPHTLIGIEFPSKNGQHYAFPIQSEIKKAKKYIAEMPDGVFSIGRAGSYQYIDIDDCIKQAMDVVNLL